MLCGFRTVGAEHVQVDREVSVGTTPLVAAALVCLRRTEHGALPFPFAEPASHDRIHLNRLQFAVLFISSLVLAKRYKYTVLFFLQPSTTLVVDSSLTTVRYGLLR